ncbi:bifunctional demethylmenaquinone methyltransferase/2-methoxy-6-polyprenyl-1,4-benzoquinol methylase UbiE [bacterium]|nr:bifunctional demethylmenaquinone methyltransferase/2-methoxy-6-polyprenyl-1,4-benzoquinol methylase UbiE [bacterium]
MAKHASQEEVAYGAERVAPEEKTRRVTDLFARVASRYDIMNDVMSVGTHRLWKNTMVASMRPRAGQSFLDLACGTGDIAKRIAQKVSSSSVDSFINLSDINPAMLAEGEQRWMDDGMLGLPGVSADFVCASAEELPFEDYCYDHVTIAFGIRNVARIQQALGEMHRVLKPGGRVTIMEFAPDVDAAIDGIYKIYGDHIIPNMGRIIAKDEPAYRYLVESIRSFPPNAAFAAMLEKAGFAQVGVRRLSFGVVAIHSGYRL